MDSDKYDIIKRFWFWFYNAGVWEIFVLVFSMKCMVTISIQVFHKLDEIGNTANITIRSFIASKKIQWQNVTPSGNRTQISHSLWFWVQHSPFWASEASAA